MTTANACSDIYLQYKEMSLGMKQKKLQISALPKNQLQNKPSGQMMQEVWPLIEVKKPSGQSRAAAFAPTGQYVPTGQRVQLATASGENSPAEQLTGTTSVR